MHIDLLEMPSTQWEDWELGEKGQDCPSETRKDFNLSITNYEGTRLI